MTFSYYTVFLLLSILLSYKILILLNFYRGALFMHPDNCDFNAIMKFKKCPVYSVAYVLSRAWWTSTKACLQHQNSHNVWQYCKSVIPMNGDILWGPIVSCVIQKGSLLKIWYKHNYCIPGLFYFLTHTPCVWAWYNPTAVFCYHFDFVQYLHRNLSVNTLDCRNLALIAKVLKAFTSRALCTWEFITYVDIL